MLLLRSKELEMPCSNPSVQLRIFQLNDLPKFLEALVTLVIAL